MKIAITVVDRAALTAVDRGGTTAGSGRRALDGVDTVVLLKEGKEVFGKQALPLRARAFAYLFSSAETKAEFDKAPEKYAIQMGGLCARMGKTVTGNPSDYLVHDGKIYIFGSDACHKSFASAPEKYLPKPAAPMPRDAAAATRGQALLDKAARQLGAKLDTVASYVEMASETQKRPTGDIQITTRKAWRFPDGARSERTMTRPDGQKVSFGTLLTANGAWQIGGPQLSPVIPEAVPSVQLDLGRQVLPLLRSRREAGTQVAALGAATVDGVAVERVRVKRGGLDVTLNLDAATGRVHSTSFIDRGRDGQFGEYTLVLLRLPRRRRRHGPLRGESRFQRDGGTSRCRASSSPSASTAPWTRRCSRLRGDCPLRPACAAPATCDSSELAAVGWSASELRDRRRSRCVVAGKRAGAALAAPAGRRLLGHRQRWSDALHALPQWRRRRRRCAGRGNRQDEMGDELRRAVQRDVQRAPRPVAAVGAADRGRPADHRQRRRADAQLRPRDGSEAVEPAADSGGERSGEAMRLLVEPAGVRQHRSSRPPAARAAASSPSTRRRAGRSGQPRTS